MWMVGVECSRWRGQQDPRPKREYASIGERVASGGSGGSEERLLGGEGRACEAWAMVLQFFKW